MQGIGYRGLTHKNANAWRRFEEEEEEEK